MMIDSDYPTRTTKTYLRFRGEYTRLCLLDTNQHTHIYSNNTSLSLSVSTSVTYLLSPRTSSLLSLSILVTPLSRCLMSMLNVALIIAVCVLTKSHLSPTTYSTRNFFDTFLSFPFFIHQFIYCPTSLPYVQLPSPPHAHFPHIPLFSNKQIPLLYPFIVNGFISYLAFAHIIHISYIDIRNYKDGTRVRSCY